MKQAQKIGKAITYTLGYSNFAFDLWMILHKADRNGPLVHRSQYLTPINRAFQEKFRSMDEYKRETNFKRLLRQLSLADVWKAIDRSERIMQRNKEQGHLPHQLYGYEYYTVNPSLSVGEVVKDILVRCNVPRELG